MAEQCHAVRVEYRLMLPLELLEQNERARILDVDGSEESVHRLEEMGLRVGVEVRMIKVGSPCIVAVGESRLTLRTAENTAIMVEPLRH